jgi:hypothetical protein
MFTTTGKEGRRYEIHGEIASLLGGIVHQKSAVLMIRTEDAEKSCEFPGILHIDGALLGGCEYSASEYVVKECPATGSIF